MVCRHRPGDSNCSNSPNYIPPYEPPKTPDAEKYEIIDAVQVGNHLCLKIKYPNCVLCAYEGIKVLVYENVSSLDALKWKRIDPHFRNDKHLPVGHAPSPAARFPASPTGWARAQTFAGSLTPAQVK